jgi:hypothetical protein
LRSTVFIIFLKIDSFRFQLDICFAKQNCQQPTCGLLLCRLDGRNFGFNYLSSSASA